MSVAFLSFGFGRCGDAQPIDSGPGDESTAQWQLSWSDEFEGVADTPVDPTKWKFDVGGSGWGNHQLEFDTDRTDNVALDGQGHLRITAKRESYQGKEFTSGRINTSGHFEQKYGRIEARLKLPAGAGYWPAFWLLGANVATNPWPSCGEIDIMEYRGQEPLIAHGSLHGPGYSGGNAVSKSFTLTGASGFDADFHVFAVDWSPDEITFRVDGRAYQTVKSADVKGAWAFDHSFFVILNLAVGGDYVGPVPAATVFPQSMLVDYVRVYEQVP